MRKLIWFAGIYGGAAAFLKLAGFLLFLWLAHILSVEDYANFGLLYALQTGLTTFAIAGIVESVIGLMKERRLMQQQRTLFAAANSVFWLMAIIAIAISLFIFAVFIQQPEINFLVLGCTLASGILLAFSSLQAQIVRLVESHLASLSFNFLVPLVGLAISGIFFFFEKTVQSFFFGSVAGISIFLVVLKFYRVGFYGVAGLSADVYSIFARVTPFIAVAFLGWLSGYGNNYVVKMFFESTDVAKFTFAFTLSSVMPLIASSLNQVWSPRFYRITHESPFAEVERKNKKFYLLQGIALGLLGGAVIGLYPTVIGMLGGNLIAYQSMSTELFFLFFAYVFLSPWWHCQNYYLAYDKGSELTKIVLITSVIGIPVSLGLMWVLGPIGVYVGFMAQMFLRSLGIVYMAKKNWPVDISWVGIIVGGGILTMGLLVS